MSQNEIDLDFLRACLRDAGALALGQRGLMKAEIKPDHSPVTATDRQVEDFLIARISARYPGHAILSEESGRRGPAGSPFVWVIDPIDGTRSFAGGLPVWGVSIGILRDGAPYAGGFYLPVTRELYWGTPRQAFYNDQPLPRLASVDPSNIMTFLAVQSDAHLYYRITYPRVRSMGSTAAHLAYAATGAAAGVLAHHIGLWDVAGLLPSLAATGISVETLSGRPFSPGELLDGRISAEPLLAAHPSLMAQLREAIQPIEGSLRA